MTSIKDHHDASRDQYISHKLYLERRAGNRFYNLGYMMYKVVIANEQGLSGSAWGVQIYEAYKNFYIALLFNPNDVDAKARIDDLLKRFCSVNATQSEEMTQSGINDTIAKAKKEFRNCKC